MKKISTIIIIFLLSAPIQVRGQAALLVLIFGEKAATENFHFSMKLGMNYSIIHGYDEGKNGIGLNFGVVNNIRLNDRFTLLAEFLPLAARSARDTLDVTRSTDRPKRVVPIAVNTTLEPKEKISW